MQPHRPVPAGSRSGRFRGLPLMIAGALVGYCAVLLAWIGGPSALVPQAGPTAVLDPHPHASATGLPPGAAVPTPSTVGVQPAPVLATTPPPGTGTTVRGTGLMGTIRIEVTSDGLIADVVYQYSYGDQARHHVPAQRSPVVVTTTAPRVGPAAGLLAHAGADATYITCTISVDGVVRTQQTAHGAFAYVSCIG